jgi:hypothetical protein
MTSAKSGALLRFPFRLRHGGNVQLYCCGYGGTSPSFHPRHPRSLIDFQG